MRRFSRKERKRRRKGRSLEDRSNTANTLNRYYLAIQMVLHLIEAAGHVQELDSRIAIFIEEAFAEGASHNTIADVLSSIHHFLPHTRKRLPYSWRLFGIWRRIEKPHQAPPLPRDYVLAMISRCLDLAWLEMACLLALGFFLSSSDG